MQMLTNALSVTSLLLLRTEGLGAAKATLQWACKMPSKPLIFKKIVPSFIEKRVWTHPLAIQSGCAQTELFETLPPIFLINLWSKPDESRRRILEMQLLDVYAHVHYHKVKTKNRLEAAAVPDSNGRYNKAMLFLDRWPCMKICFLGFGDF